MTMTNISEDTVMFSACHLKFIASAIIVTVIGSYIVYADLLFSAMIFIFGFLFLTLSFMFYLKNKNTRRDTLLNKLEKKGRKELKIEDTAESIKMAKKDLKCPLSDYPANIKEYKLSILYLGSEYLTIYNKCPNSHIHKIYKKKAPGDSIKKPIEACAESEEYYYSYIQSVEYKKDIILTLNSGEKITMYDAKKPAKVTVNKIRKYLRKTEKNWVENTGSNHSRGSHNIKRYD